MFGQDKIELKIAFGIETAVISIFTNLALIYRLKYDRTDNALKLV